jgi:hypothetical protein
MIYNEFVSKKNAKFIKSIIFNKNFTWKFKDKNQQYSADNCGVFQFVHSLYDYKKGVISDNYDKIMPIISEAFEKNTGKKIKRFIRTKVNLLTKMNCSDLELLMMEHQDLLNEESKNNKFSIVYYVENSDGDTVIFDKYHNIIEQASPIAGNAIVFDSMLVHRATPPKNNSKRVVVNSIFEVE